MEVRTKPTMCKKLLRSVMAVAFSAGLAFGVFGTQDLSWSGTPTTHTSAGQSSAPPDLSWSAAPADAAA